MNLLDTMRSALRAAVVLTMQRLCFASVVRFTEDIPAGETIGASVAFRGPVSGAVSIAMPRDAPAGVGQRFVPPEARKYGVAEDDFIAEIATIVCANVVPHILDRGAAYELQPPELRPAGSRTLATAVVHFDEGWVAAT